MTHDEMIAVIQAHKDGKKIRRRPRGIYIWSDYAGGGFDFVSFEYEIKPEPMEIWAKVKEYSGGHREFNFLAHSADEGKIDHNGFRTVKFREVLDD